MAYRKVYFRIRTECYSSGWSSDADRAAFKVEAEGSLPAEPDMEQMDLFTDHEAAQAKKEAEAAELAREKKLQEAMLNIKSKFGKNAILKGTNLVDGATAADRNSRIGGHKA